MNDIQSRTDNYVSDLLTLFAGYGDAEALVTPNGRRFSYRELREQIINTAALLWEHGARPGKTVCMLVTNTAESYFAQLGAHLIGCRTSFMSRTSPYSFLSTVLTVVEADLFIYEVEVAAELGPTLAGTRESVHVLCIGPDGIGPDITDPPAVAEPPFDPAQITTEPYTLFQTTGTTGTPKMMRHGQRFFRNIARVNQFYRPSDGRPLRQLNASGTWHAGGQSATLMTWYSGGTAVMLFDLANDVFLRTVESERVTSILVAPATLYSLLDDPQLAETDLSQVTAVTISAGPPAPARLVQANTFFGPALNVVYGMGELPFISVLEAAGSDPERLASCGKPWGDVQVEIRDADGNPVPAGELGEIWVTSDLMIEGYIGDAEVSVQRIVDGWLRSGDIGRFDADGYLYIVDRVNDMINYGGNKVYSRPIEDTLAEHPQVRQAAVIAVPDTLYGEAPHACVVPQPGATVTADELRQFVVERANEVWAPREVEFVDALPLNGFGKVDKRQLRESYLTSTS